MSSFTIHLLVPVLIVLATRLFPTRTVLLWAPFAVLPDVDTAINLVTHYLFEEAVLAHRALLHNVFILIPSLTATVLLWRRMLRDRSELVAASWRTRWDAFGSVKWGYPSVLITFYLFSHLLLDLFQGGITVLWPLLNVYVYPQFWIHVDMATGVPSVATAVATGTGAPTLSRSFRWMTPEEVGMWIMAALAWLAHAWHHSSRARGETPLELEEEP